jgi:predicted transcriptional regulator
MHKDEASQGFTILSNSSRVKIAKFLYVRGDLSYDDLLFTIGDSEDELKESLDIMEKGNLIIKKGNMYSINKEYIDELLDFIRTPCGCCHN